MWSKKSSTESKLMSIQLLEPIIFVGSNSETSPVVRGTIHIALGKRTLVQNLSIHFKGMMNTQWRKGNYPKWRAYSDYIIYAICTSWQ